MKKLRKRTSVTAAPKHHTRACATLAIVLLCAASPSSAQDQARETPLVRPGLRLFDPASADLRLAEAIDGDAPEEQPTESGEPTVPNPTAPDTTARKPSLLWAGIFSGGVVTYNAVKSFTDHPRGGFRFADEGWFGVNTYAGGADKASHVAAFAITARELAGVYEYLGFSKTQSAIGGFALSSLGGLVNELGDGTNRFGFSYEDLLMDFVGAGAATLMKVSGTDDLFGIRFGIVPGPKPSRDPASDSFGKDYSNEIYTIDVQLAGIARRLGTLWPLRFLLLSTTYGTRGYPYAAPDDREQLLGFEAGINFAEVLYALDVKRDTWWGITAHILLDNFRVPYTQLGFRYDLHRGTFHLVNAHGY